MGNVVPAHNLDALLIGTGEFFFSRGSATVSDAVTNGFLSFGNIAAFQPKKDTKMEQHVGSYRGVRRKDKTLITEAEITYTLTCDEWNLNNIALSFGAAGATAGTFIQSSAASQNCDAMVFSTDVHSNPLLWYPVTVGGIPPRGITAITFDGLAEGSDFFVDYDLGQVRFATAQTASVTPVATIPAIVAGNALSYRTFQPLTEIVQRGVGRLVVYDQDQTEKVVLDHYGFNCEIWGESMKEQDGTKWADMALSVLIVPPNVGTMNVRQINAALE